MARLVSPLAATALFFFLSISLFGQTGYWVKQNLSNGIPTLRDIDMLDEDFGIAVGASDIPVGNPGYSGVAWTTNGGNTWLLMESVSPRFTPELPDYTSWNAVHIVDSRTAWIVGDSAMIYKTGDGGLTWTQQIAPWDTMQYVARPTLYDVHMIDGMRGIAVGGDNISTGPGGEFHPPQIYRTFDGGRQWIDTSPTLSQINNNTGALRCVDYVSGTFLFGGEFGNLIMDQGTGYQVIEPISPPALNFIHWWDVDIKSPTEFFMVGTQWLNNTPAAYRTIRQGTRFASMVPGNIV
ncbi:MAG: hypothetical protein KFF77_00595, partial [Bacteroidetes bacterium]|nr:hypothetical protein [Bacteroidota bacterium]